MTPLAANSYRKSKPAQGPTAHPVKGSTHLYKNGLVCSSAAAGLAIPGADVAGLVFLGIAQEEVNNTGADSAVNVKLLTEGSFKFAKSGTIVRADIGRKLYIVDDDTVGLYATPTHKVPCGTLEAIDGSEVWVKIEPLQQGDGLRCVHGIGAFGGTDLTLAVSARGLTKVYRATADPVGDTAMPAACGELGFTEDASTGFPEVATGNVTINRVAHGSQATKVGYTLWGE
jgi:hypothetical protein